MYRIGIFDNEAGFGAELEEWILHYGEVQRIKFETCIFPTKETLLKSLEDGPRLDVLFLAPEKIIEKSGKGRSRKKADEGPKEVSFRQNRTSFLEEVTPVAKPTGKRLPGVVELDSLWKKPDFNHLQQLKEDGVLRGKYVELDHSGEVLERTPPEEIIDGVGIGRYIREDLDDPAMQLIYVTDRTQYDKELLQTRPMDTLLLPVSKKQLEETLAKAIRLSRRRDERFVFQKGKNYFFLPTENIYYFCSDLRKVRIISKEGEFVFNGKLKEVRSLLTDDFLVIHKSYIVNRKHILRYEFETLEMEDGTVISISKPNQRAIRNILLGI